MPVAALHLDVAESLEGFGVRRRPLHPIRHHVTRLVGITGGLEHVREAQDGRPLCHRVARRCTSITARDEHLHQLGDGEVGRDRVALLEVLERSVELSLGDPHTRARHQELHVGSVASFVRLDRASDLLFGVGQAARRLEREHELAEDLHPGRRFVRAPQDVDGALRVSQAVATDRGGFLEALDRHGGVVREPLGVACEERG